MCCHFPKQGLRINVKYSHIKITDSSYYKSNFTPIFTATLFIITKQWKQLRCPTINEWIKKMRYLYTIEFYSATKKNEILSFASKWMELENIILNKANQTQKAKNRMFSLLCGRKNAVILLDMGHTLRKEHTWEK
jgi:hypothetical protein